MVTATDRYTTALARISTRTSTAVLRLWDDLPDLTVADSLEFHRNATPVVRAAATASVDLTVAYAATLTTARLVDPSDLIVDEAVTHLFDPFDRYARLADDPGQAAAGARSVASSVGRDSVYRTARHTIAEAVPAGTFPRWVRLVTGKSCRWCMNLSTVEFPSAAAATFGHTNCDCVPVPTQVGTPRNTATRDAAGWDDQAAAQYRHRHHRASLNRQARTARRRSSEARLEQVTEADPARRERLSIREQEWETRAERAEERLRLLDTGTHRLT
jgi:hypothetical protein